VAASTVYTTDEDVVPVLPKNYDSASDLTRTHLTAMILNVSRIIDARLSTAYIPFNSTTGTPPTPVAIQAVAKYLVIGQALRHLAMGDRNASLMQSAQEYEGWGAAALDSYISGLAILPPEQKTGAVLTVGVGGDYDVETDQAFIGVEALVSSGEIPTMIPESVKVTSPAGYVQYNYGYDFDVMFNPQHQKWVFHDLRNDFISQTTPTIQYDWTWERYSRDRTPKGVKSGLFVMG